MWLRPGDPASAEMADENRLVAAAAAAAAAPAAGRSLAEAGLRRSAVHGKDGELPPGICGTAVRARGRVGVHADELLEVLLALHARVLVDRHDRDSNDDRPGRARADRRRTERGNAGQ